MLKTGAFLNFTNIKSVTEPFLTLSIKFESAPAKQRLKQNFNAFIPFWQLR